MGVVTPPDRRRGRGSLKSPTPVGLAAQELGLPLWHDVEHVTSSGAELGVVVAYGHLIRKPLLDQVPMLNVHFSLLPRWRGAAPVERAILAGDEETGVCIMGLEATLDTGPIFARATTPVGEKSAAELLDELSYLGAALLCDVVRDGNLPQPVAQSGDVNYAAKLLAEDFHLTPLATVEELGRIVRCSRAYFFVGAQRVRVVSARRSNARSRGPGLVTLDDGEVGLHCANGVLGVQRVVPAGGREMLATDWARGARLAHDSTWS